MPPAVLTLTGHVNGVALRFGAEVVADFATWDEARAAYQAAITAQFLLSALLAKSEARP